MPIPPMWPRNSTAVTSAPSLCQTEPCKWRTNSNESNERAPVDETIVSSSIVMPGKGVTSEPVAMRMFLAVMFSVEPSFFFTETWLGPVIVP
ncbi:hypothetical protein WR25_10057 [Diploscapter pachys]|uniref:Uncharacterized protein n=1 Tax=Diploscapter pachys TaxID=2018661 RepID=A0A2A2JAK9_9BILA|nr:hypothetical protein WR25_10057 [Diploscapter pachys]